MPPRPLHRWKSFWFGVLILAFLGWAWVSSVGSRSELLLQWDTYKNLSLSQANGRLFYVRYDGWNQTLGIGTPKLSHHPIPEANRWRPAIATGKDHIPGMPGWFVNIAHWLLILLFLIPWSAFLLWRAHRQKRLAAEAGEPQP